MARSSIEEFYQNFRFHLVDITPTTGAGLSLPLLVLSPQIGFKSVSAPSYQVEQKDFRPGNDPFPVSMPLGASPGPITLSRGVYTGDRDFYQWMMQTIAGRGIWRRDLALIQIHPRFKTEEGSAARIGEIMGYMSVAFAQDGANTAGFGVGGDALATGAQSIAQVGGSGAIPDVNGIVTGKQTYNP